MTCQGEEGEFMAADYTNTLTSHNVSLSLLPGICITIYRPLLLVLQFTDSVAPLPMVPEYVAHKA